MSEKWCPENDGAYRMELAEMHRRSEKTYTRADLEKVLEAASEYVSQNSFTWRFSSPWCGKDFAKEIRAMDIDEILGSK